MAYDLRPLSFAEVLDRSFQILRDNVVLLAGIMLAATAPNVLIYALISPRDMLAIDAWSIAWLLFFAPLGIGAVAFAVADICLGRKASFRGAYRSLLSIIWQVLGTWILSYVICFLALIAFVVPGVYLFFCWYLLVPVMVVEQRFGMRALGRSRALVRGNWWQAAGLFATAFIITLLPEYALDLIWMQIPVAGRILGGVSGAVFLSFPATVVVVYYFERRCRLEDFGLRLLAEQIRSEGAPGGAAMSQASTVG